MKRRYRQVAGVWMACMIALLIASGVWRRCAAIERHDMTPVHLKWRGLENVFRLSPRVFSGSEPDRPSDFQTLSEADIEVVVSVDGARPDVGAARARGLRYVHIPVGYSGLSRQAELALVRVMREYPGKIYVHCHHGKHRGPAAAAIACMADGAVDQAGAKRILQAAGTDEAYAGLWQGVAQFEMPRTDEQLPELLEAAEQGGRGQAMAELAAAFENLEQLAANDWRPMEGRTDLSPAHEALLVWEGLRESYRLTDDRQTKMLSVLTLAIADAQELRNQVEAGDWRPASGRMLALKDTCTECHRRFRDNP